MSDNDCISRSVLYAKTAEWEAQALHMVKMHMHDEDATEWRKWSTILTERSAFKFDVASAPAVPQEMSAREFFPAMARMCEYYNEIECNGCPLNHKRYEDLCTFLCFNHDDSGVADIVSAWAREHTEEMKEANDE